MLSMTPPQLTAAAQRDVVAAAAAAAARAAAVACRGGIERVWGVKVGGGLLILPRLPNLTTPTSAAAAAPAAEAREILKLARDLLLGLAQDVDEAARLLRVLGGHECVGSARSASAGSSSAAMDKVLSESNKSEDDLPHHIITLPKHTHTNTNLGGCAIIEVHNMRNVRDVKPPLQRKQKMAPHRKRLENTAYPPLPRPTPASNRAATSVASKRLTRPERNSERTQSRS